MTDAAKPGSFRRAAPPPGRLPSTSAGATNASGTLRLNKRMAELGLASRREADEWIAQGWVKVDGEVATVGMQVKPDVHIEIHKQAQGQQANQVTILLNKRMEQTLTIWIPSLNYRLSIPIL